MRSCFRLLPAPSIPVCLVFLACLVARPVRATLLDAPPPPRRLVLTGFGALRGNPLGLSAEGRLALRQRLYASDSLALQDNFLGVGVQGALSPATGRLGVIAQLQPLTVLSLYASADAIAYFGTFDNLQSYASANAEWGNDAADAAARLPAGDQQRAYAATNFQLTFGARLQLKAGPFALANTTELVRNSASLRDGDRVLLDPTAGGLVPQKAFVLSSDLDLLWLDGAGLVAGLRGSLLQPFFGDRHFAPGERQQSDAVQVRAGPLLAYRFFKEDGRAFNAPTVFVLVNWYLHHRYRTGAEVSQALPYLAVGFGFFGDLIGLRQ